MCLHADEANAQLAHTCKPGLGARIATLAPPLRTIREMMLRCLPLHRTGTNE